MDDGTLARRLGLGDAVAVGACAMIGAGLFAVFAPAARTGAGLLSALVVAGVVAYCNATSSAQLAVQHPSSGGTYLWARQQLGDWPAFAAGWSFVVGKTASCGAMALTAATYALPAGAADRWAGPLAAVVVLTVTAVALTGITRTARVATLVLLAVLAALLVSLAAIVLTAPAGPRDVGLTSALLLGTAAAGWPTAWAILQAAGLLFFAFAGYARIATLAEEVRDPARTIPRAVLIALGGVLVLYAVTATVVVAVLGPVALGAATAPLADAADASGVAWVAPVVRVAACLAATGALLALTTGLSRTVLAMARGRDLPRALDAVSARHRVPARAEVAVAAVVVVLVLTTDLRGVIGFSSFGVLLYYAVANASALTQHREHRLYPRPLQVVGLAGCLLLCATLPTGSVVAGLAVLAAGFVGRAALRARAG